MGRTHPNNLQDPLGPGGRGGPEDYLGGFYLCKNGLADGSLCKPMAMKICLKLNLR